MGLEGGTIKIKMHTARSQFCTSFFVSFQVPVSRLVRAKHQQQEQAFPLQARFRKI